MPSSPISTIESAPSGQGATKRSTLTQYRYEIGIENLEAYDNVSNFADAGLTAFALAKKNPKETIYIYDRMARRGKAELWHVVGGDLRVVRVREVQS